MGAKQKYDIDNVVRAFAELTEERGPSMRELADRAGFPSTNTAKNYIERMRVAGFVEPISLRAARGYRLTDKGREVVAQLNRNQSG
jgi:predicted transcriptional regulator